MNQKATYRAGFSFVELIVVIVILGIISTIGFISYSKYLTQTRDSVRASDLSRISSELSLYKRERGAYPLPGSYFEIHNRGETVAYQGKMNQDVALSTSNQITTDPKKSFPYVYSVTDNRQEYQISATLEVGENGKSIIFGDYKSVSKNILPSILLAMDTTGSVEINQNETGGPSNREYFILDQGIYNLGYDVDTGVPYHESGIDFDTVFNYSINHFWQNTDYTSCSEIFNAGKGISPTGEIDEYQIRTNTGVLANENCTGL